MRQGENSWVGERKEGEDLDFGKGEMIQGMGCGKKEVARSFYRKIRSRNRARVPLDLTMWEFVWSKSGGT